MPDAEQQSVQQTAAKDAAPGHHRGVAFVLPVLVLASAGFWLWVHRGISAQAEEAGVHFTLHLDTFVLNLADSEQRSYLRIGIDLGLARQAKSDESVPTAEVRDTILGVLAEAKVEDLLTAAGKARLKRDLLRALQERMPTLGVEEVYFTELLIQR